MWKCRMEIYQQSFRCNKTIYFSNKCPFQILIFCKWSSYMCCCFLLVFYLDCTVARNSWWNRKLHPKEMSSFDAWHREVCGIRRLFTWYSFHLFLGTFCPKLVRPRPSNAQIHWFGPKFDPYKSRNQTQTFKSC